MMAGIIAILIKLEKIYPYILKFIEKWRQIKMKKPVVSIFKNAGKEKGEDQPIQLPPKQEPVFNFDIVISVRHDSKAGVSGITAVNPAYYQTLHSEKITLIGVKNILEMAKNYFDNKPVSDEFCIKYDD